MPQKTVSCTAPILGYALQTHAEQFIVRAEAWDEDNPCSSKQERVLRADKTLFSKDTDDLRFAAKHKKTRKANAPKHQGDIHDTALNTTRSVTVRRLFLIGQVADDFALATIAIEGGTFEVEDASLEAVL